MLTQSDLFSSPPIVIPAAAQRSAGIACRKKSVCAIPDMA